MKSVLLVATVFLAFSCALPKQPKLTSSERSFIDSLSSKFHCNIERYYSSNYLRYGRKGSYILSFRGPSLQFLNYYIKDSGFALARHIYNNFLISDSNIILIEYHVFDSIGVNTYRATYSEFRIDSL
jgi:hypothetical protein